jgi:hypothetical protein
MILPIEIEEGNIEYKRSFLEKDITKTRLYHLTAQMNWRINEGNGICHYYLGICNDGTIYKDFDQEKMDFSLDILKIMIDECNAYIETINLFRDESLFWIDVVIKRKLQYYNEYRILFINESKSILSNIIPDYHKTTSIFHNIIIHNNEKYLFFECKKSYINKIKKLIDFNLILYEKDLNTNININILMNYVENNMYGNIMSVNELVSSSDVIFNIIKHKYIDDFGYIVYGFLKQGNIKTNMILKLNNNINFIIYSIHNNKSDCNHIGAPATISLHLILKDHKDTLLKSELKFNSLHN